jgi:hypothetical protein
MNSTNLDSLNREELARFIVTHRETQEGIEARRLYISRFAQKVNTAGINFKQPQAKVSN